jgi:sulfatase modifying factor 1
MSQETLVINLTSVYMMKYLKHPFKNIIIFIFLLNHLIACGSKKPTSTHPSKTSTATGRSLTEENGFKITPLKEQYIGPNFVFIDGGSTIMGVFGEDVNDSPKRAVTVTSFYMKETEVTNAEWKEYIGDLKLNASDEEYKAALPDAKVWVRDLGYNDPYLYGYFTEEGFNYYPIVGVSWTQANKYCDWLTKKLYEDRVGKNDEQEEEGEEGKQATEVKLPITSYRLPTEAEWEYAARGMVGATDLNFIQSTQRVYPWGNGLSLRGQEGEWQGKYLANFKRSKGDYKGIAGESDSNGPTSYVWYYPPNDLGLYDMGGNVSEWVVDLYRPISFQDFEDFNPVRRDDTLDPEKNYDPHNSLVNNRSRVYKGASWKDCAYWAKIGTRRFLDQDSSTATIGFRYAITSMGGGEDR